MQSYKAPEDVTGRGWIYALKNYARFSDGELAYRRGGLYRGYYRLTTAEIRAWAAEHMTVDLPTGRTVLGWTQTLRRYENSGRKRKGMHLYEGNKRLRVDEVIAIENQSKRDRKAWRKAVLRIETMAAPLKTSRGEVLIVKDFGYNGAERRIVMPEGNIYGAHIVGIRNPTFIVRDAAFAILDPRDDLYMTHLTYLRPDMPERTCAMDDGREVELHQYDLTINGRNDSHVTIDGTGYGLLYYIDDLPETCVEDNVPTFRKTRASSLYRPYELNGRIYFYLPGKNVGEVRLYRAGIRPGKIFNAELVGTVPLGVIGFESRLPEDGHAGRRYDWPHDLKIEIYG